MATPRRGRRIALALMLIAVGIAGVTLWMKSARRGGPGRGGGVATGERRPSIFAPEPGEEVASATGVIEGVVLDPQGAPFDGAALVLSRARPRDSTSFAAMRPAGLGVSAGGGRFVFRDLQPGDYGVTAMAAGFSPGDKVPIELAVGAKHTVELRLGRDGAVLSGRVLDAGGGVIPGARVRASQYSGGSVSRTYLATADDAGVYKLSLGKGSSYGLTAEAEGYAPARDGVRVTGDTTRDLRLVPAARLFGRVVERASRAPVPDAEVWLVRDRRDGFLMSPDVKTDASGQWTFNDVQPGAYSVSARKARLVGFSRVIAVSVAETVSDIEIETDPGLSVSGRVLDPERKPVGGVVVHMGKEEPPYDRGLAAKSAADGAYLLEGVLPGRYRLSPRTEGYVDDYTRRKLVRVVDKDLSGVDLTLTPSLVISGLVVSAEGRPVEGASVNAMVRARMETGGMLQLGRDAKSDAEGRFALKDLIPGDITLSAKHADFGAAAEPVFKMQAGEKKVVKLTLGKTMGVSGVVRYDDGGPAEGISVFGYMRGAGGRGRSANDTSGPDGKFTLAPLDKGEVQISARSRNEQPGEPTKITLEAGEHKTGVEIKVPRPNQTIAGTVFAPDGKPMGGASVFATRERDGRAFRSMGGESRTHLSGPDGAFVVEDLGKGTYTLWAFHSSHAEAEAKGVAAGATGVKLQFPAESGVAGAAVGPDGKPVVDYTALLIPGAAPNETPGDRSRRLGMAAFENPVQRIHDPSGAFEFRRLKAGSWEVKVTTSDGRSGSAAVTLAAGERKTGVRVALAAGAKLQGRVVDAETGSPLADVSVSAGAMAGGPRGETAKTDAQGAFTVENVPTDQPIRVLVDAGETYVREWKEVEPPRGQTQVDLGAIRMLKGNNEATMFDAPNRGNTGLSTRVADGRLTVTRSSPGSPAEKAGLKPGDVVVSIDGKDVRGLGNGAMSFLLAGNAGTQVAIGVESPGGGTKTVNVARVDPATLGGRP